MTDQIRLKINQGPALRCKVLPGFAGTVAGTSPIVVAAGGGIYTASLDLAALIVTLNATYQPLGAGSVAVGSITGLGTGIATWLATPTSANLAVAVTDETGTGALVFGTAPIFTTNLTAPLVIGGSAVDSTLILKSTSGVGSSDAIVFQVGSNGAIEAMRFPTAGQVLIGGTSAVDYGSLIPRVQLHATTGTASILWQARWSNDATGSAISISKSRGTTVGSFTIVQSGDTLGTIAFRGSNGTTVDNAAAIVAQVDGTPGASGDMPGRLIFQTTPDGSGTLTEAFRVNSAQQINVATATDATTATTGSVITAGGIGVAKAIVAGTSIKSVSPTAGIGYATGAGGTVTQATDKTTGVTLSKVAGAITMNGAALAAATIVSFTLTNTAIAATDVLVLNHISGGTPGSYTLNARAAAGSATIDVRNNTAGSLSEAIVIQFVVIKGVNA